MTDNRPRVLIVDDDQAFLETAAAVLDPEEFDVTTASSPAAGLVAVARGHYHVICADWRMPGIDGVEFLRMVTATGPPSGCILMTGHHEELLDQVAPSDRKYLGFLKKPCSPEHFLDRVRHYAGMAAMKRATDMLRETIENRDSAAPAGGEKP